MIKLMKKINESNDYEAYFKTIRGKVRPVIACKIYQIDERGIN